MFRFLKFQFTPLREGRQRKIAFSRMRTLFQFTPLREGRREIERLVAAAKAISIHAPA